MTERNKLIRETILVLFQNKQHGTKTTMDQINELFDLGIITEKSALRFIVKSEYHQMILSSDISCRSAFIDLSIKWDISDKTVENIIYKTPAIKALYSAKK